MRVVFFISLLVPLFAMAVPAPLAAVAWTIAAALSPELAVALIAAVVGPLVSFIVAARKMSGRIETTEAHDLWEESARIRDWSLKRIDILNRVVSRLEERLDDLERENRQLREDNLDLHRQVNELRSAS